MKNKRVKLCFAASSGGHYEQILMLKPLMKQYDSFIVTEKTKYLANKQDVKTYYLSQVNRRELVFLPRMFVNCIKSFWIITKERPDVVICTGVLAMIPLCLFVKLFGGKLIYIESFAKVTSGTLTGKFLYHFADRFYVQWPEMLKIYPGAIYQGGIY